MIEKVIAGSKIQQLPLEFFTRTDVVQIARDLIGKVLVTEFDGQCTAGVITETEAYRAPDDRACHAFDNRRTARTEVMFQEGGSAYVYICYGIHHLFNVVTGPEGMAHAVLIRAIELMEGQQLMVERRQLLGGGTHVHSKTQALKPSLTTGPGALAQAMGIHTAYSGQSLLTRGAAIWIGTTDKPVLDAEIAVGKRIGVESAGDCAAWPWRFWLKSSKFYKKPLP